MSKNKNCKGNGPNVNTTQANVNQQMFELQDEIEHLMDGEFGNIFDNRQVLKDTIEKLTGDMRTIEANIKYHQYKTNKIDNRKKKGRVSYSDFFRNRQKLQ